MTKATGRSYPYSPFRHALEAGINVVYVDALPSPKMAAAYSPDTDGIYIREGLAPEVERCALAHEISHWEHRDTGTPEEEARADTVAAVRLIPLSEYLATRKGGLSDFHASHYLGVTMLKFRRFAELYNSGELAAALAAHTPPVAAR